MRDDGCYVEVDEYKEDSQSNVDTTYSFSLPVAGRFYGTEVKGLYTRPLPGNIQNTLQTRFCLAWVLNSDPLAHKSSTPARATGKCHTITLV